ncbi:VOC family protein [Corallincola platygyrae]|uniref:VOC family protein n=1 Tax=Corallincola platygyrae TaxID=1193278 RepID=A0ABW4XR71_9GAMM
MPEHEKVNYLELPAADLEQEKAFFNALFGWQFQDYGPDYVAFSGAGIDGGFYRSNNQARTAQGSALIVFYSESLEQTLSKVEACGGSIIQDIFEFPGGRRFHFTDPNGNEFAVWSDRP